ncbi:hypothetical protein PLICRDRAFT_510366 [Plicaturopsis crispa FD-325 SS-3]|nr:hypothetical protein PLICRDRAFT_510366 [Plicaturopsis crispa FD-325 SS-3]
MQRHAGQYTRLPEHYLVPARRCVPYSSPAHILLDGWAVGEMHLRDSKLASCVPWFSSSCYRCTVNHINTCLRGRCARILSVADGTEQYSLRVLRCRVAIWSFLLREQQFASFSACFPQ